ncbi:TPA: type 1 fimbrial protein [Klebsiella quasipneumoniae subsp. similipneumoniae]|nr:type 1 fimbrial protein [Klebsiella quasipneumoniae subsp. similipneumoniae]HBT4828843.1 type 1 fimbrial protein [Klebsiella quasipneumoniae subsp. similipneumoniae]
MMHLGKIFELFLFSIAFSIFSVSSNTITLNISGKILTGTCTVSPVLIAGQQVPLGSLERSKFKSPGAADPNWHNFSLELTNCSAGITTSTVTFSGAEDSNDRLLFANTEPELSAAKNMAVQISRQDNNNEILSNGSSMTVNVNNQNGTASFPLAARMITPVGNATAGEVSSLVLVTFTYQ